MVWADPLHDPATGKVLGLGGGLIDMLRRRTSRQLGRYLVEDLRADRQERARYIVAVLAEREWKDPEPA